MNNKVIEVKNLVKKFGSFVANDNLNFEVNRGEIFGFLGAITIRGKSGCFSNNRAYDCMIQNISLDLSNRIEGKCVQEGFIKRQSIRIVNYSAGIISGKYVTFTVVFECLVCRHLRPACSISRRRAA